MEDERISALLDSNNGLSLVITQNNETIQNLKTENDSLKSCGFKLIHRLIQKIKKQKLQYDINFRGNEYAIVLTDFEIKFMQSIQISSEDDVRTQDDVEKLLKHTAKAGYILSKLYKARDSYNKCTKSSTLIADNSIPYDDLSTQTDFTLQITSEVYHRMYMIGQKFGTKSEHLQVLQQKVQFCRKSLGRSIYGSMKEISKGYATFENLALTKKSLVKLQKEAEFAFLKHSDNLKDSLLNRIEILELVRNDKEALTALYLSDSSDSDQPNKRNCSSQTDISTLRLSLSFEENKPNDTYENQIASLHGQYLQLLSDHATYSSHAKRIRLYIDRLSKGEEIVVLESDLSYKSRALLRKGNSSIEDQNYKKLRKVKSTLNSEIDVTIKKTTESFQDLQVTCDVTDQSLRIDELEEILLSKNNHIDEQSKRITEIQTQLINQISDEESKISLLIVDKVETERNLRYEQSKVKELNMKLKGKESEISKLNTKVSNQNKTNSQQQIAMNSKCKEIEKLKEEAKKISCEQTSKSEVNKLKSKIRQSSKLLLDFYSVHKLKA